MTSTNIAARTTSTVINASDFSNSLKDVNRHTWTSGPMAHVIKVLEGSKVIITTDKSTGHTLMNVELRAVDRDRVLVIDVLPSGREQATWYSLFGIGMILPLGETLGSFKYKAIASHREHASDAIAKIRAEHGEAKGRAWGSWNATPFVNCVHVTYTPHTGNPAFADQWGERGYWTVNTPA